MGSFAKFLGLMLLVAPVLARGQVIADRTTLNSIVGANGKTVDFQAFSGMSSGGALVISGLTSLDSTTLVNGQGPNLVPAGVVFKFPSSSDLQ